MYITEIACMAQKFWIIFEKVPLFLCRPCRWFQVPRIPSNFAILMNYPKNFPGQLGSFIKSCTFVHLIFCEYFIILCFIPFYHTVFLFGVLPSNLILRNFLLSRRRLLKWWLSINKLLHQHPFFLILNSWKLMTSVNFNFSLLYMTVRIN